MQNTKFKNKFKLPKNFACDRIGISIIRVNRDYSLFDVKQLDSHLKKKYGFIYYNILWVKLTLLKNVNAKIKMIKKIRKMLDNYFITG